MSHPPLTPATLQSWLTQRPLAQRLLNAARGRVFRVSQIAGRDTPIVVIAHWRSDRAAAARLAHGLEHDWIEAPEEARTAYNEILAQAPGLVVVQLRRKNVCGCLGHRHVIITEPTFVAQLNPLGHTSGELDLAWQQIDAWRPLPLSDTALDAQFLPGSRLDEFRERQTRLKLLSVFLHEVNHLVFPKESESSVLDRSLNFYRETLAALAERTASTMALTLDRSPSRLR